MGTYSIEYTKGSCYGRKAMDWNWHIPGMWTCSETDGPGGGWYSTLGFDDRAYHALLEHFGLEQWPGEFPASQVVVMSPYNLVLERRRKEIQHNLPQKEVRSSTIGYHILAEDHVDSAQRAS